MKSPNVCFTILALCTILCLGGTCGRDNDEDEFRISVPFPDVTMDVDKPVYLNLSEHIEASGGLSIPVTDWLSFTVLDIDESEIEWSIEDNGNCTVVGPVMVTVDEYRQVMSSATMSHDYDEDYADTVYEHDPTIEIPVIKLVPKEGFQGLDRMTIVVKYSQFPDFFKKDSQLIKVRWE